MLNSNTFHFLTLVSDHLFHFAQPGRLVDPLIHIGSTKTELHLSLELNLKYIALQLGLQSRVFPFLLLKNRTAHPHCLLAD